MAAPTLVKHPAESRLYAFDFGAAAAGGGPRGTVWGVPLLGAGEAFAAGLSMPLLFSGVPPLPTPTITVARADGLPSDLTLGSPQASGTQVRQQLSGGTDGKTYTLTCVMTTNLGDVLAIVGTLLVTTRLP